MCICLNAPINITQCRGIIISCHYFRACWCRSLKMTEGLIAPHVSTPVVPVPIQKSECVSKPHLVLRVAFTQKSPAKHVSWAERINQRFPYSEISKSGSSLPHKKFLKKRIVSHAFPMNSQLSTRDTWGCPMASTRCLGAWAILSSSNALAFATSSVARALKASSSRELSPREALRWR